MANQTLTGVTRNMDDPAIAGLLDGEDITINNSTLIIDSDSRWGQQAAVVGNITISSTLGGTINIDGTKVWWLQFDASTGTVPALGVQGTLNATGSIAGIGEYLGIWPISGFGAPLAAGGAMPATGFMKLRRKTVDFVDNEVVTVGTATITINSATGGRRGWIHVVGEEATTITVPRMGTLNVTGDWYELGTTNGADDQTFQYPVADHCPAIQIETAVGSGVYEWWLNADAKWGQATQLISTDERGKFFGSVLATGVITIARRATNPCGFKPVTGLRVRIPNVLGSSAATAAFATNTANVTPATRWDLTTTGGGVINVDRLCAQWYLSMTTPYSVSVVDTALGFTMLISNCHLPFSLNRVAVGLSAATNTTALSISTQHAGGTITECRIARYAATANAYCVDMTSVKDLTITSCRFTTFGATSAVARTAATAGPLRINTSTNVKVIDCDLIGGAINVPSSSRVWIRGTKFADITVGATTATQPLFAFVLSIATDCVIEGFENLAGIANVHPNSGILSVTSSYRIDLKKIGTAAAPYNMGSAIASGSIASIGLTDGFRIWRVYCFNNLLPAIVLTSAVRNVLIQNVWADAADTQNQLGSALFSRGNRWTNGGTAQPIVYNRVWEDSFTGTTTGQIVVCANEAFGPYASQAVITAGTPVFNSSGAIIMRTVGDQVTWECPYFILGYTALANIAPTLLGTNTGNFTMEFAIDTGAGFGGYLALTGANLSAQTINANPGFRLRVRATTAVASTTNALTYIRINGVTNSTDQQIQYPAPLSFAGRRATAMRYQTVAAGETWAIVGRFVTGRTVTCAVWNANTGAAIAQTTTTTAEIAGTGLYRYLSSQLTTNPLAFTLIAWQMTDALGDVTDEGLIAVGGHVDNIDDAITSRPTAAEVADAVWDEAIAGHLTAGSTGAALNGAGAAGDPWLTALPGAYAAGTAGNIVGNRLDVAVGTRESEASAATRATTDQTEHDATQAAIAALPAAPSAATIADAVWDEPRSGHTTAGTYGQHTGDAAMRGTDGANTVVPLAAATDQAEHDATQAAIAALPAAPSVAAIADGVWDEPIAGHLTAGSTGLALNSASSAGDPWATAVPGAYAAGTAGNILGNRLDAAVSSRESEASAATRATTDQIEHDATQAAIAALPTAPSAAVVADAVWDELLPTHTTATSAGDVVNRIAYQGAIWIALDSGAAGTGLYLGTPGAPVNNISDAITIGAARGLTTFRFIDSESTTLTLTSANVTSLSAIAATMIATGIVNIEGSATGAPHTITAVTFQGPWRFGSARFAYGNCVFEDCSAVDFAAGASFLGNTFRRCALAGTINGASSLSGANTFIDCSSAPDGTELVLDGDPTTILLIDMFYRFSGNIRITNLNAVAGTRWIVDLLGGSVTINTAQGNTQPARATIRGIGNLLGTAASGVIDERLDIPTAGENADAVWDEVRAGHTTAGTYGQHTGDAAMRGTDGANTVVPLAAAVDQAEHDATQAAIAALPAAPSAAVVADAVWDEATSGHVVAGSFGAEVVTHATPAEVNAQVAAALATYDAATGTDVSAAQTAIIADTGATEAAVLAAIGALNNLSQAGVQAAMTAQGYTTARATLLDNLDATVSSVATAIAGLNDLDASQVATAVWNALRSSHAVAGTTGSAMTILLNAMASRGLIDTSTSPWIERRYVFNEGAASDSVVFETFELYDQAGVAIAGTAASGNNPLADPTRIIAERRRV